MLFKTRAEPGQSGPEIGRCLIGVAKPLCVYFWMLGQDAGLVGSQELKYIRELLTRLNLEPNSSSASIPASTRAKS